MRRRVVWIVAVLAVLVGGAAVVDSVVRVQTEDRIASEVTAIPGIETTPGVTIGGFPFLTQLAGGSLQSVRLTAPAATIEGLLLQDVVVDLTGVATQDPYTAHGATMTASTTPDAVEQVLTVDLDLAIRGDELVAAMEVLGLPLDVVLLPRAAGREVQVDITGFRLAGVGVSADQLPPDVTALLQGLRFSLDGLPVGMTLTEVGVADGALQLRAVGSDLDLTTVAAP